MLLQRYVQFLWREERLLITYWNIPIISYAEVMITWDHFQLFTREILKTNLHGNCDCVRTQRGVVRRSWVLIEWVPGRNTDCTRAHVDVPTSIYIHNYLPRQNKPIRKTPDKTSPMASCPSSFVYSYTWRYLEQRRSLRIERLQLSLGPTKTYWKYMTILRQGGGGCKKTT